MEQTKLVIHLFYRLKLDIAKFIFKTPILCIILKTPPSHYKEMIIQTDKMQSVFSKSNLETFGLMASSDLRKLHMFMQ